MEEVKVSRARFVVYREACGGNERWARQRMDTSCY